MQEGKSRSQGSSKDWLQWPQCMGLALGRGMYREAPTGLAGGLMGVGRGDKGKVNSRMDSQVSALNSWLGAGAICEEA